MNPLISRRTVLKGVGTAMALPLLEGMGPARAFAAGPPDGPPVRMAFLYFPNGAIMQHWTPKEVGTKFELPHILAPLEKIRSELLVLSGLSHHYARANGDGPGDHARSTATFLTGRQARKTRGRNIKVGISVDQVAAKHIGDRTPLPSLEVGCERGAQSGNCDSGYSCAYSSNISWRTPSSPMTKEVHPRLVFERLFGDPDEIAAERDRAKRAMYDRSILDLVREDARRLNKKLGGADRGKLDEYLESVRAIERRIQAAERDTEERPRPEIALPRGIPRDYAEHLRLTMDLLILAFQTDTSRIATFMFGNAGSNRTYPWLGVRQAHHNLSHHGRNRKKMDLIRRIDRFQVEQFAYLIEKMKATPDGDGTLLDNSMILYGCAIADGNAHNHNNLPVLLAGRGGGTLTPGRHVRYKRNTPMCNLFLSMLDRMEVE